MDQTSNVLKIVLVVVLLSGCGHRELPRIAADQLSQFSPAVAEAIGSAYRTAAASQSNAAAVGRYCMMLHAHGQFSLAQDCLSLVTRLAPRESKWQYYLGVAFAQSGNLSAAIEALNRTLELEADYFPARLRRADLLLQTGRNTESLTEYQELTRLIPEKPAAWYGLGRSLVETGDRQAAIAAFDRACRLFPPYAAAHYAAAQAYRRMGNLERADYHSKLHSATRQMRPPLDDPRLDEILRLNAGPQVHIERSTALAAAGRLEEAVAATREALRVEPSSVQAHANLISLYGRLNRFVDAETHYKQAIAVDPAHADAHYNYGVLLLHKNRVADAAKEFQRAVGSNPRHADAQNNLGVALDRLARPGDALKHFLAAVDANPSHRGARYNAGRLLIGQGRPAEAVEHFREALEPQDEGSTDVMYGLATAYIRSGDIRNGRASLQKAYDLAVRHDRTDLLDRLRHDLSVSALHARR